MSASLPIAVHPSEGIHPFRSQLGRSALASPTQSSTTSVPSPSSSHILHRSIGFPAESDHGLSIPGSVLLPDRSYDPFKRPPTKLSMRLGLQTNNDDDSISVGKGEGSGNEIDHEDSDAAAHRLWLELAAHRRKIRVLRGEIGLQRESLRAMRRKLAEADNKFMNALHKIVFSPWPTSGVPDDMILGQFKLQDLRTKHSVAEAENKLYKLEDELQRVEYASEQIEDAFFRHIYRDSSLGSDGGDDNSSNDDGDSDRQDNIDDMTLDKDNDRPSSRTSLLGIPLDRPVDLHPTYIKLLNAIGDKNQAIERHEDLVEQREAILEDIETRRKIDRRRDLEKVPVTEEELEFLKADLADPASVDQFLQTYNIRIDEEDLDFIRSYPEVEKETRELVESTTIEVKRLWSLCIQQGAMFKHPSLSQDYIIRKSLGEPTDHLHMDIDLEPGGPAQPDGYITDSLAHTKFDVLLSNPKHLLDQKTAKTALEDAIGKKNASASRGMDISEALREVQMCIKEVSIEGLITQSETKTEFVNGWLLQHLRTTPLEVRRLLNMFSFTTKLRVKNLGRWQNDVLRFWMRDEAATRPESLFDGALTFIDSHDFNLNLYGVGGAGESRKNSAASPRGSIAASDGIDKDKDKDEDWIKVRPGSVI